MASTTAVAGHSRCETRDQQLLRSHDGGPRDGVFDWDAQRSWRMDGVRGPKLRLYIMLGVVHGIMLSLWIIELYSSLWIIELYSQCKTCYCGSSCLYPHRTSGCARTRFCSRCSNLRS